MIASDKLKEVLRDNDEWEDFMRTRMFYRDQEGMKPKDALIRAASDYGYNPDGTRIGSAEEDKAAELPETDAAPAGWGEETRLANTDEFGPPGTLTEVMQWTASNLDIKDISRKECPGSQAWSLRNWAKQKANRTEFYRMWTRYVKDAEGGDGTIRDDGRSKINLLDRIERAGRPG